MTELDIEIPDFLKKRGITKVVDNVPKGHGVLPPVNRFMVLFGEQALNAVATMNAPDEEAPAPAEQLTSPGRQATDGEYREFMEELEKSKRPPP